MHRVGDELEVGLSALLLFGDGPEVTFADMTRPRLSRPAPTPSGGVTSGTDYEHGYSAVASARWRGLSLLGYWADRLKGLPAAPGDSIFGDRYNSVADRHAFAELSYRFELLGQQLLARVYYDQFRHRQHLRRDPTDWAPDTWLSEDPHTVSEGNDDTSGAELQGTFQPHSSDTVIAGVEVQTHRFTQPTYELDLASGAPIPESLSGGLRQEDGTIAPIKLWNIGLYLQNDWRPLDWLGLVAGLRFDHNSLFSPASAGDALAAALSPRAAVLLKPAPAASVKLMYGQSFRNPSPFEAFYDDSSSVCGNATAKPERARTVEAAALWAFAPGYAASAALYYSSLEDLLQRALVDPCYVGSGARLRFVNQGRIAVLGGEAGVEAQPLAGFRLSGNLGAWRARSSAGGEDEPLANSPALVATVSGSYGFLQDHLVAGVRVHLRTARLAWTLDEATAEPAYAQLDLRLGARRLLGGLGAWVVLSNALNGRHRHPVTSNETIPTAVPADGVAVSVRVGYEP